MGLNVQQMLAIVVSMTTAWFSLSPQTAYAQDHVLPLNELHFQVRSAAQQRAQNLADLNRVLSLAEAQSMLAKASVSPEQVRRAISRLSDEEVAHLANRARAVEQDVHGGLIVGLLALIGLIVVIVVVLTLVKK